MKDLLHGKSASYLCVNINFFCLFTLYGFGKYLKILVFVNLAGFKAQFVIVNKIGDMKCF